MPKSMGSLIHCDDLLNGVLSRKIRKPFNHHSAHQRYFRSDSRGGGSDRNLVHRGCFDIGVVPKDDVRILIDG